jgi:ribulose kinase
MSFILGVDFGTGGVRVGAFDSGTLKLTDVSEEAYTTSYPHPGWAEQWPGYWWDGFVAATGKLLRKGNITEVGSVTVSTTASTVVVTEANGSPVRPAILRMDARADAEARFTGTTDHPVLRYSGGSDAVEWLVPKAMWLAKHEPETYRRAERIVEAVDFINFRLMDEWVGSKLNATCKWNYDPEIGGFHPSLFTSFGISNFCCPPHAYS